MKSGIFTIEISILKKHHIYRFHANAFFVRFDLVQRHHAANLVWSVFFSGQNSSCDETKKFSISPLNTQAYYRHSVSVSARCTILHYKQNSVWIFLFFVLVCVPQWPSAARCLPFAGSNFKPIILRNNFEPRKSVDEKDGHVIDEIDQLC